MPMGIVSNEDFEKEKERLIPPVTIQVPDVEILPPTQGRGEGNKQVPNSLRRIIGETSKIDGRPHALEIAQNFGISESSVSAYANGSTSTASYNQQPNLDHINQAKERVSKRARNKMMLALNNITNGKLSEAKVRDLAGIAKDMSAIIKNMEPDLPKGPEKVENKPTFVFYAPQILKEEQFETITAKDDF